MGKKKEKEKEKRPFISKLFFIILIIALLFIYARYVGVKGLKVKEYSITSSKLPESFDGFTVLHFSDLKYGSTIFQDDVKDIVKKINELKPDVVFFTGDIVSSDYKLSSEEKEFLTNQFKKIEPLIDKYSVKGDQDKDKVYHEIIDNSGFIDVTNSSELLYYKGLVPITIYGLDSLVKERQDFNKAFYSTEEIDSYKILLVHEPDTIDLLKDYKVNLMLSGHSLNGTFNLPYIKNLYDIDGATKYNGEKYSVSGTKLYVSSGLGTNELKCRLFNKPSISVYRLYKK